MDRLLDIQLLGELERRLRDSGAPLVDYLRPGLSISDQNELATQIGISLSEESQLWWSWHDGAGFSENPADSNLGWIHFLSLEQAVEETKQAAEIAAEVGTDDLVLWSPDWLAFLGTDGASITCDCNLEKGQPSAVRYIDFEMGSDSFEPIVPSLRDLVEFWIEALERKYIVYQPEMSQWQQTGEWPDMVEDLSVLI